MSRASNLAGFTTAVGPPTDLNVGVVTATSISAQTITSTDTYSFTNLDIGESISVGSSTVGVTTINSSGINSPLGIGTFNQVVIGTTSDNDAGLIVASTANPLKGTRYNAGVDGATILLTTSGSNTVGTSASLSPGDEVGALQFRSYRSDDTLLNVTAKIQAVQTGGAGGSSTPTDLIFFTSTGNGERLRIDHEGKIGINSTEPAVSVDISEKTDAVALPVGTTAQRPSTAYGGYIRWNSTSSALEVYNGTNWVEIISDYFPSGSTTLG